MLFLAEPVTPFDWQRLVWTGEQTPLFALEVAFRCVVTYLMLLAALRITGRRSVKQLSLFELSILIGLGSIAGDTMFYSEVPISHAAIVFGVVMGMYWLFNYLTEVSPKFSDWMEGKEILLLEHGHLHWDTFHRQSLTQKELFGALRQQQVEHLGQLKAVYSEATGEMSVFFYEDSDVCPGLSIIPAELARAQEVITTAGPHACTTCGNVAELQPRPSFACPVCREARWLPACTARRIT
ncbi:DUF421 domain-containing protein [Hymenobacter arizonensis]|uniref:Uncharacterized membrane protein YcaP, DUF421 family n=1 Tax=Hymenobacter arizonensis TaxID=1227077 RepID=A0A1I6ATV8_HYMAR|nr:YetF domain-containing protein [Hymenobacter arizonensis]SFQ72106.1 Uncharacterized membrane protein YcaP, DUF421 family [Hymenobacter arizonensis]